MKVMPIEIKELHIKASVVDRPPYNSNTSEISRQEQERMKKEIIKACVQEVIQILEDKRER
jgi:hypothetical protein